MSLHAVRLALRGALADLAPGDLVLIGCSGGPDSLALAAAAAGASGTLRFGAVIVDHRLQSGSAATAALAAATCTGLGLHPVEVCAVDVGDPRMGGGPEASARRARRAALRHAAERHGAKAVLLAHTLDDQAETVLLRLARGSGARSLSAMAQRDGLWRRPLLGLRRDELAAACAEAGLTPHRDPHNDDPSFTRVRVRRSVLPTLEAELGPGVAAALARSAQLLRADADALDELVERWWTAHALDAVDTADSDQPAPASVPSSEPGSAPRGGQHGEVGFCVRDLIALPQALRTRVLRRACVAAGCPAGAVTYAHVQRIDRLLTNWRGQGAVALPGQVEAERGAGHLRWFARLSPSIVGPAR